MTKEEIEYLSKFERNYYTALHSNYTSAIWNDDLNAMLNIYKKYKGDYNLCKHCSASILAFVKKVGLMYEEEKNIKDVLSFSIDKDKGILEFKEPVNLKKESVEFRIRSIYIEPDEKSKITRGIYEIANIIPTTYDKKDSLHNLKATIQIPVYKTVDGKNIPTSEGESVTIDLLINPENGVYVNKSSKIIKNIDIYCFINTEVNEEEKREKEFNKKLTMSEKDMNKLLENAVSEGLINDNK